MSTKKDLLYIPAPPVQISFYQRFNSIVPPCPGFPNERYLRFVWGMDRLETKGEGKRRRYPDPKGVYVGIDRWILEGWQSSDVYDRADWEANESVLGPFPRNGVWDHIAVHETADKEYLPLDETAIDLVASWAFWRSKGHKRSTEEILARIKWQEELDAKRRQQEADKITEDFVEEAIKAQEKDAKNSQFSLPAPRGFKTSPGGILLPG